MVSFVCFFLSTLRTRKKDGPLKNVTWEMDNTREFRMRITKMQERVALFRERLDGWCNIFSPAFPQNK